MLWPSLRSSNQIFSVLGLNLVELRSFGLSNKASELGFRWLKKALRTLTGHLLEPDFAIRVIFGSVKTSSVIFV